MAEKMTRAELVEAFRAVGFDEAIARRGADLMEAPQYFGFEDVAASLMSTGTEVGRNYAAEALIRSRIPGVARRVDGGWVKASEARLAEARAAEAGRQSGSVKRSAPATVVSATFVDGKRVTETRFSAQETEQKLAEIDAFLGIAPRGSATNPDVGESKHTNADLNALLGITEA